MKNKQLKVMSDNVLEAAQCTEVRDALKVLFPKVFKRKKRRTTTPFTSMSDGRTHNMDTGKSYKTVEEAERAMTKEEKRRHNWIQ